MSAEKQVQVISSQYGVKGFNISLDDPVSSLCSVICAEYGVEAERLRLIYGGTELTPTSSSLRSFGVGSHGNCNVHLSIRPASKAKKSKESKSGKKSALPASSSPPLVSEPQPITASSSTRMSLRRRSAGQEPTVSSAPIDVESVPTASTKRSRKRKSENQEQITGTSASSAVSVGSSSSRASTAVGAASQPEEVGAANTPADPPKEKRAAVFVRTAPSSHRARVARAVSQRMYLLSQKDSGTEGFLSRTYAVLGSTGNVYDVIIEKRPKCTCPDHLKGNLCKHIIFVMIKVLHQDRSCKHLYQKALLQSELQELFARPITSEQGVLANQEVVKAYKRSCGELDEEKEEETKTAEPEKDVEGECPICFEDIDAKTEALSCCKTCKNHLHRDCMTRWLARSKTCPYCRSDWVDPTAPTGSGESSSTGIAIREGYLNLGQMQGQNTYRDTSTYNYNDYWYYRRRRYY